MCQINSSSMPSCLPSSSQCLFSRPSSDMEAAVQPAFQIQKQRYDSQFWKSINHWFRCDYSYYTLDRQLCEMEQLKEEELKVGSCCEICYCNYPEEEDTQRPQGICYSCWLQHVTTSIMKISYQVGTPIISPFQGKNPLDVGLVLNTLSPHDQKHLQEWLFKKYTTFTLDIDKCPAENCDFVFLMEKCQWSSATDLVCPKCEMPLTPQPKYSLKSILGFIYFIFIANKCPKCEIPIQKTSGCPHMSCPCGHQFCWFCLKDHCASANNVYSIHEPKQCVFILLSKVFLLITCLMGLLLTAFGNDTFQSFMSVCFLVLRYVFHALMLDLSLFGNFIALHHMFVSRHYERNSINVFLPILLIADMAVIGFAYFFDLFYASLLILMVECAVVIIGAGLIYLCIYLVETWFDFIA